MQEPVSTQKAKMLFAQHNINIGIRIYELRIKLGWTQAQLGDLVEVDQAYISGIERGIKRPSLAAIKNIANALGLSLQELLGEFVINKNAAYIDCGKCEGEKSVMILFSFDGRQHNMEIHKCSACQHQYYLEDVLDMVNTGK